MKGIFITLLGVLSMFSCETTLTQQEEKQPQKDTVTQSRVVEKDTNLNGVEKNKQEETVKENSKCAVVSEIPKDSAISSLISKTTRVEAITFKRIRTREYIKRMVEIDNGASYTQIKNNKVVLDSVTKRVDLNKQQIQRLFDVLFKYKGNHSSGAACYEPHHVLVFYEQNKIIAFLEICFTCKGTRDYGVDFTDFCDEKWEKLREFF